MRKIKKILGLTILEGLISTAVVGIEKVNNTAIDANIEITNFFMFPP